MRMESHMIFICPECNAPHENQHLWRKHLNTVHDYVNKTVSDFDFREIDERYHECMICKTWVANAHQAIALLQYHRFLHLPFSRTYKCRHCANAAFTRKRALCEHLQRFHSKLLLKDSERERKECYIRYICPQCGLRYDSYANWLQHIEHAHSQTSTDLQMHRIMGTHNHYCLQCKKMLYTSERSRLQRHRFSHLPFRYYFQCACCRLRKTYKAEILKHYILEHPREFEQNRQKIRMIEEEWGAALSIDERREIEQLLKDGGAAERARRNLPSQKRQLSQQPHQFKQPVSLLKNKQEDILQKALAGIDFEQHSDETEKPSLLRTASEIALDQSLKDLEDILRKESGELGGNNASLQDVAYDLDELCKVMFEQFEDEQQPTATVVELPQLEQIKEESIIICKQEVPEEAPAAVSALTADASSCEEQLVCIEIDALEEDNGDNESNEHKKSDKSLDSSFEAPKAKRLKLDLNAEMTPYQLKKQKDTEEKLQKLLEDHIHYLCPECGLEFINQHTWRSHVFKVHNIEDAVKNSFEQMPDKKSYLCLDCQTVQHTLKHADLQRHRFQHMPFQSYLKCVFCHRTKSRKPKIIQHLKDMHSRSLELKLHNLLAKKGFRCVDCRKRFPKESHWQMHRKICPKKVPETSYRNYNIEANNKMLEHLKSARQRIKKIAAESGIELTRHHLVKPTTSNTAC